MLRRIISLSLCLLLGVSFFTAPIVDARDEQSCPEHILRFQLEQTNLPTNRGNKPLPKAPYIESQHMMVPLRVLAESIQAQITWHGDTREITIQKQDLWIRFQLDEPMAVANGKKIRLPVAAQSKDGLSYGPLRSVANALGAKLEWNGPTRTAQFSIQAQCGQPFQLKYTFANELEGWDARYIQLQSGNKQGDRQSLLERAPLPMTKSRSSYSLQLQLPEKTKPAFMYAMKKISLQDGLVPDTIYHLRLKFNALVQATEEIEAIAKQDVSQFNLMAGLLNQEPGMAHFTDQTRFNEIQLIEEGQFLQDWTSFEQTLTARTTSQGELYIWIGIRSSVQDIHLQLYLHEIEAAFQPVNRIHHLPEFNGSQ